MRNFPIRERLSIQLRIEAFNARNHPSFDNPDSTLTCTNVETPNSTNNSRTAISGTLSFNWIGTRSLLAASGSTLTVRSMI